MLRDRLLPLVACVSKTVAAACSTIDAVVGG
jgi:hypothetical protein